MSAYQYPLRTKNSMLFGGRAPAGPGPMNPDAQGPIQPPLVPTNPIPDNPYQPTPESEAADAREAKVRAEGERIKNMSAEELQALRRSQYSQAPGAGTAADYLATTGVDPEVFRRADPTLKSRIMEQYERAGAFNPSLDLRDAQGARASQMNLAQMLQQRAQGQGSVAAAMLEQQGERAAQDAFGLARAGSAYNPGMAQMLGERGAFEARSRAMDQARVAALQEQAQSQDMLGGLYGQMRGQDLQSSGMGSQLQLQAEQMRRGGQLAALGMRTDLDEADRAALIQREQLVRAGSLAGADIAARSREAAKDRYWRLGGQVIGAAADAGATYWGGR